MHYQAGLHTHGRAISAVHPFDLARDQSVAHIVETGTPVFFREGAAQHPLLSQLIHNRPVEGLVAVRLNDAGHQPVLGVGAGRIAHQPLLLAQHIV